MKRLSFLSLLICMVSLMGSAAAAPIDDDRAAARKLQKQGNWKEAFEAFEKLLADEGNGGAAADDDLQRAYLCLQRLNQMVQFDAFVEKVIADHADDWRVLARAGQLYMGCTHWGYVVAGEFKRGHHRGGGQYVNAYERDRTRALGLMERARGLSADDEDNQGVANFLMSFANAISGNRSYNEAWRLQNLTDFQDLPDWADGGYYGARNVGTPVDANGEPLRYSVPKSWEEARNDGERWRFLLTEVAEVDPSRAAQAKYYWAGFLRNQFGVETLNRWGYGGFFGRHSPDEDDDTKKNESGVFEIHTLKENESISRLATGVKRLELPDEHNHIVVLKQIAEMQGGGYEESATNDLASIFENRRQYSRAAELWQESIRKFGPGSNNWKVKRLNQILDNWGRFDGTQSFAAGEVTKLGFVFRNGEEVEFEAFEVDVQTLLGDMKDYLKSNPVEVDGHRTNLGALGWELVNERWKKYVGRKVAGWELRLEPRENHWDRRIDVVTPLKNAGAYLLRAKMADGNTSNIVVWLADTAIAKKPLDGKAWYFIADAAGGNPVAKANVEFFGFRYEYLDKKKLLQPRRRYNILTRQFAEFSDEDGQLMLGADRVPHDYQWLITATTGDGRFAYHGFTGVWYNQRHDAEYKATKVLFVTDRPVYRPSQDVEFKAWVRHAQYDKGDESQFAGKKFTVRIHNPKGEKIYEKRLQADEFGGVSDKITLPGDATLGVYNISIPSTGQHGGNSFRVEEYKKPEFEVIVDAPSEPVMLGEKVPAKITAKYLFGAPVQNATVKYKVMRSEHDDRWFAPMPWDWFYGPGYWWFCYDYDWYPGWKQWGCRAPLVWWWPRGHMPPEVVLENEVEIGEDGTVEVEIDTALAKAMHGDIDHNYSITAEVRDESRRTIVGTGNVLVARKPFKVNVWLDRGYYRVGDVIGANACARTLDGKPVAGEGRLTLYRISYDKDGQPVEKAVENWDIDPDAEGCISTQIKASSKGQYRLSYKLKDKKDHEIEGAYVFVMRGDGFDGKEFRFNDIEIITDKREYAPGESVKLMVNTAREGSTVAIFLRPANGIYLPPRIVRLDGKSTVTEIEVSKKDMPNFFIEAMTISAGRLYEETREIIVPPEKRVLNVEVLPSEERYKPGAPAKVKVKLTSFDGEPFVGSTVVTVYDKALEYISGGSNVPEIRDFFWKWRRHHRRHTEFNLNRWFGNTVLKNAIGMGHIGIFGASLADDADNIADKKKAGKSDAFGARNEVMKSAMPMAAMEGMAMDESAPGSGAMLGLKSKLGDVGGGGPGGAGGEGASPEVQPVIRSNFADLAYWAATLNTDQDGTAEIELDMPENLTTWKIKTWGMGHGTRVGQGEAEVITSKDLIIRLQAPRFFVEKDEVVLSANVHNYLDEAKDVRVVLELGGETLAAIDKSSLSQTVKIEAGGEERVDWRVKAVAEGEADITMKALTDEESDAMQMSYPVFVHGMLKTESFSGAIRPDGDIAKLKLSVPAERRPEQTRLEVRYSPSLATAMVDALPYLADYPYGCTEQTLNRFVPTVITQKILIDMGLDLKAIRKKRTNLNAQEIGKDKQRARQWKRWDRNPVFDDAEVDRMVKEGVERLTNMQNSDGGWGWFYGRRERSWPHTTAVVVHGLQLAQQNDVALVPGILNKGVAWLERYQKDQVQRIKNWPKEKNPRKPHADNLDAFVFMVLVDADKVNTEMRDFLYRDRNELAVYSKAMTGLAMHKIGKTKERDMLIRNIEQFLVVDDENQSAYLELGNGGYWWYWYGSEIEAQAYYLKLLAAAKPEAPQASGLAKYLINNRKHATYWNSTRDTAIAIEALADFIRASGENEPDMTVEILLDGKMVKEVEINKDNLFTFDNKLVLVEDAVDTGEHTIEFRKKGRGALYFNAYLTNFTLEDFITKAGLEVKVEREYYKLVPEEKTIKNVTQTGGSVDQKVEKYKRVKIASGDTLKSGDLVEIELIIESKNDYEYLVFDDMKAAGFEPVDVRSGYNGNAMGAYMELRDEKVTFFVRALARGKHSLSYRMRAEIPGKFSALPAKGEAMYAPELKANSDEIKVSIVD